jgi:hypothetical protein
MTIWLVCKNQDTVAVHLELRRSKKHKMNPREVAQNACHRLRCKLQQDVSKKVELDSECPCFDEFPLRRFELAPKLQTEKFPGDLQDAEYLFVLVFNFVKNFFFCDLLIGDQDRAYSFRNP